MRDKIRKILRRAGRKALLPHQEVIFLELLVKANPETGIVATSLMELEGLFGEGRKELIGDLRLLRDLGYIGLEMNKESFDESIAEFAAKKEEAPFYVDVIDYRKYVEELTRIGISPAPEEGYRRLLRKVFEEDLSVP